MGWTNISEKNYYPDGALINPDPNKFTPTRSVVALFKYRDYIYAIGKTTAVIDLAGAIEHYTVWQHLGPRATPIRWQQITAMSFGSRTLSVTPALNVSGYAEDSTRSRVYIADSATKNVYYSQGSSWTVTAVPPATSEIGQLAWYKDRIFLAHDKGVSYYTPQVTGADTWTESLTFGTPSPWKCNGLFVYQGELYVTVANTDPTADFSHIYRFDGTAWTAFAVIPAKGVQYLHERSNVLFAVCDNVTRNVFSNALTLPPDTTKYKIDAPVWDVSKQLKGVPSSILKYTKDNKLYVTVWNVGHETESLETYQNKITSFTATTGTGTQTDVELTTMIPVVTSPYIAPVYSDVSPSTGGFLITYPTTTVKRTEIKKYRITTDLIDVVSGQTYTFKHALNFKGTAYYKTPRGTVSFTRNLKAKIVISALYSTELSPNTPIKEERNVFEVSSPTEFLNTSSTSVNYSSTANWTVPPYVTTGQFVIDIDVYVPLLTGTYAGQDASLFGYAPMQVLSCAYFLLSQATTEDSIEYIAPTFIVKTRAEVPSGYSTTVAPPSPPDEWFVHFPSPGKFNPRKTARKLISNPFLIKTAELPSLWDKFIFSCFVRYRRIGTASGENVAPLSLAVNIVDAFGTEPIAYNTTLQATPLSSTDWTQITWEAGIATSYPFSIVITGTSGPLTSQGTHSAYDSHDATLEICDISCVVPTVEYAQNLIYRWDGTSWDYVRASSGMINTAPDGRIFNLISYTDIAGNSGPRIYCIHKDSITGNSAVYVWSLRGDPGVDPRDLDEGRRLIVCF